MQYFGIDFIFAPQNHRIYEHSGPESCSGEYNTSRSRVRLEKLILSQLVKKSPPLNVYGTHVHNNPPLNRFLNQMNPSVSTLLDSKESFQVRGPVSRSVTFFYDKGLFAPRLCTRLEATMAFFPFPLHFAVK